MYQPNLMKALCAQGWLLKDVILVIINSLSLSGLKKMIHEGITYISLWSWDYLNVVYNRKMCSKIQFKLSEIFVNFSLEGKETDETNSNFPLPSSFINLDITNRVGHNRQPWRWGRKRYLFTLSSSWTIQCDYLELC